MFLISISCSLLCDFNTEIFIFCQVCLSSRKPFRKLSELAVRYLSVPGNSVDAERSIRQYTVVSVPQ